MAGGVLRSGKPFFFLHFLVLRKRKASTEKLKLCFITNALVVEPPTLKANLVGLGKGVNLLCRKC